MFPNVRKIILIFLKKILLIIVFQFIQITDNSEYIIKGIKHYVYIGNTSLDISEGGIGSDHIKFQFYARKGPGIRSIVHFYGQQFNSNESIEN